jgi:hypothetical protein
MFNLKMNNKDKEKIEILDIISLVIFISWFVFFFSLLFQMHDDTNTITNGHYEWRKYIIKRKCDPADSVLVWVNE